MIITIFKYLRKKFTDMGQFCSLSWRSERNDDYSRRVREDRFEDFDERERNWK